MVVQLKQICAILSGLVVASDFRLGQEMLVEREFSDNAEWFKSVFEIGRRYKIQNPDAMRGAYGMMMYMIQVQIAPQPAKEVWGLGTRLMCGV